MNAYELFVDIYSGNIGAVHEHDEKAAAGLEKAMVEDRGSAIRVVCLAADKDAAKAVAMDEHAKYCAMPISQLDRHYPGRERKQPGGRG